MVSRSLGSTFLAIQILLYVVSTISGSVAGKIPAKVEPRMVQKKQMPPNKLVLRQCIEPKVPFSLAERSKSLRLRGGGRYFSSGGDKDDDRFVNLQMQKATKEISLIEALADQELFKDACNMV